MPTDDGAWDQLLDEMDGVFTVTTEDGSVFGLDLDARLVCVAPEILDAGTPLDAKPAPTRLLTLVICQVGAPMVMLIDRGTPGVWFTRRTTAPVTHIETASGRSTSTGTRVS